MELRPGQATSPGTSASARIVAEPETIAAYGWRDRVRLPRTGPGAVRAIAMYRYETRSWQGPRRGYAGRSVHEGLALVDGEGRVLLDVPGGWDPAAVRGFAAEHGLDTADETLSPRALTGTRRLELAPRKRLSWDDGISLTVGAALVGAIVGWLVAGRYAVVTSAMWSGVAVAAPWLGVRAAVRVRYLLWRRRNR